MKMHLEPSFGRDSLTSRTLGGLNDASHRQQRVWELHLAHRTPSPGLPTWSTALAIVEKTAGADHLTGEQLEGWLGALESLRLFLGTQLDVTEETYAIELDPDDPSAPALALYSYLSWLQEQAVEALSSSL